MDQQQVLGVLGLLGSLQSANTQLRAENSKMRAEIAKMTAESETAVPKRGKKKPSEDR